jgi:hypothetical protein
MTPEPHLRLVGVLVLLVAALHGFFPRWFAWRDQLARLSLLNRQIFLVHAGFIVLVLALTGLLSLLAPRELLRPGLLGTLVLLGLAVFWAARMLAQWFVYDAALWRGSLSRTMLHGLAVILCAYFTGVYSWAAAVQSRSVPPALAAAE